MVLFQLYFCATPSDISDINSEEQIEETDKKPFEKLSIFDDHPEINLDGFDALFEMDEKSNEVKFNEVFPEDLEEEE